MIKMEPCKGCGAITLMGELAPGVTLKCDPAGIDAQTAAALLMVDPHELWTVRYDSGRMSGFTPVGFEVVGLLAGPRPPNVIKVHHCPKALSGDLTASQRSEAPRVPASPQSPPVAPHTPSVGPSTDSSTPGSVQRAARPAFDQGGGPRCAECSEPMADGTYFAIELGDLMQYAAHVERCTG